MINISNRSKKELLWDWMVLKRTFTTHEVIRWGSEHFYDRADRTKRDLLERGLIRKLTEEEKERRGFKCKDAVYTSVVITAFQNGEVQIRNQMPPDSFFQDEQTKKIMEDLIA